ncbi:MAG: PTS transporter subunit EIIA [Kiritimatiellaeota bacterium]|nr:PTS transporter subunit EIIA [Kiritimatiellota bacterium]
MKLSQLLRPEYLIADLKGGTKRNVISGMLERCDLSAEDVGKDMILDELLNRESEQSTGLGEGMAFPHARLSGLMKIHILLGISKKGMEFESLDGKPAHFIVMTLVDHAKPNELLKTRAAIVQLLSDAERRAAILAGENENSIWKTIESSGIEVDYEITAKDITRPVTASINPDCSAYAAARELHRNHIDSLPVMDDSKTFHGEISCFDLFSYGLPDFFNSLHVISFVKHMDPFEKYFNVEKTLPVSELLSRKNREDLIVSSDATLMEIIFEMTVKRKETLYVLTDDGKLRGILDRYSIIDKIIIAR